MTWVSRGAISTLGLKVEFADDVGYFDLNRDDDGSYPWWKLCGTGTLVPPVDAFALTCPPVLRLTDGNDPIGSTFAE